MANETTTKFKADISSLRQGIQQASREIRLANAEFKSASAGMDDWSKSADGLNAKINQTSKVLKSQKTILENYEEQLELIKKEYGENSRQAQEMQIKIENQRAKVIQTEKALSDYEKALDTVGEENLEVADSVDTANEGFTVAKGVIADLVANGISLMISGLKDLAKEVLQVGADFESAMSQVAAVSGANADEIEQLTEKAEEMGAKTKFSATESAEAFNYMAMAGWKTEDMLDGIEGIMNLAAASGSDLATASDIVTDALTAMGYAAEDAGRLADVMAAASSNANTNVELMGSTFQYAAPIVGALGYSMEDTAVAIGLMANAGIKGDKAGTALRSTLTRLSAPPTECADAMEELGITLTDAEGNMKDLDEVMGDLRKAFADLSETEQTQYAKALAGQEAMSGLLAIVNASTEDYDKLTTAIDNSNGAAAQMAETMEDNVNGQLTLLKSKIEGIMIKLFNEGSDSMKRGIKEVSNALDLIDWDEVGDKVGDFAKKAADLFAYLIKNGNTVINIIKTFGKVVALAFVANKVGAFAGVINGLIATLIKLKTATAAAETAQLGLNAAQLATPVGALIGVTTALVALYVKGRTEAKALAKEEHGLSEEEEELHDNINDLVEKQKELNDTRDEAISSIKGEYSYIERLKDEYNSLIDSNGEVKEGYEERAQFILNELSSSLGLELEDIQKLIEANGQLGSSIDDVIAKKKAEAISNAYADSYAQAKQTEQQALDNYIAAFNDYKDAEADYNGLLKEQAELKEKISSMTDEGKAADTVVYQNQLIKLNDALEASKQRLEENKEAVESASGAYEEGQQTIKAYENLQEATISGQTTRINSAIEYMTKGIQDGTTATEEELQKQVEVYQAKYDEMAAAAKNGAEHISQEALDGAKANLDQAIKNLDDYTGQVESKGDEAATGYANAIDQQSAYAREAGQNLSDSAYEGTENPKTDETGEKTGSDYVQGIELQSAYANQAGVNIATSARAGMGTIDTTQSGEYFAQGFINGMGNLLGSVGQAAANLAKKAIDSLKQAQQEGSPSKITTQSGVFFAQGFENGIKSGTSAVVSAAYKMAQKAVSDGLYAGLLGTRSVVAKNLGTLLSEMLTESKDLSKIGTTDSSAFAGALENKLNYEYKKIAYLNEQKQKAFDTQIENLKEAEESELEKLKEENEDYVALLKSNYAAEKESLEEEIAKIEKISEDKRTKAQKKKLKALKAELEEAEERYNDMVADNELAYNSQVAAIKSYFENEIEGLENLSDAFSEASSEMLSELQSALSEYQSKAQELINSTMSAISTDYSTQYDALINKQDSLIEKLKSAGDLFSLSSANVMTVNDIQAQTAAIKEYASKLSEIKKKVSSTLFDEIASYNMEEGSAFIDRLLSMSEKELQAYSDAFDEKMSVSEALAESIYSSDFDDLSNDYASAIKDAFASLPSQLEELGSQTIAGFISGLTSNTDYMSSAIKSYISQMISEFKSDLGIHSPSKVMAEIGEYTGEGFTNGLLSMIDSVKKAAEELVDTVSSELNFSEGISLAKLNASQGATAGSSNTSNVANSNQTIVFNQTNNSPKALDSLQIYRNTNNLLFNAKVGLSNV